MKNTRVTSTPFRSTYFFNDVNKIHGKFDLVYSANTISHIHDLNDALQSINLILNDEGVFILEDPSLLEVIKNISYDQFYDEHAYVFSVLAINNLLKETELKIFDIEKYSSLNRLLMTVALVFKFIQLLRGKFSNMLTCREAAKAYLIRCVQKEHFQPQ